MTLRRTTIRDCELVGVRITQDVKLAMPTRRPTTTPDAPGHRCIGQWPFPRPNEHRRSQ
jgi:hypothetical protein